MKLVSWHNKLQAIGDRCYNNIIINTRQKQRMLLFLQIIFLNSLSEPCIKIIENRVMMHFIVCIVSDFLSESE